jgi:predicted metalloprotease with PDZ domain
MQLTALLAAFAPVQEPIRVTVSIGKEPSSPVHVSYEGEFGTTREHRIRAAPAVVGAYEKFPFGRFIRELEVRDDRGLALPLSEESEGVWLVRGHLARLSYEIDAAKAEREIADFLVTSHRREGFTLLSGYATYLLVGGAEHREHQVAFEIPAGWRVATALPGEGPGPYRARDALELLDEPAALGTGFTSATARHGGALSLVHAYADPPAKAQEFLPRFVAAQEKALASAAALELPVLEGDLPYHVFLEIVRPVESRDLGWALEHGRSFQGAYALDAVPTDPDRLAYHFTHHLLHAWLPRRLFTDRLDPRRQLEGEASEFIGFAEGFAQYLAFVGLARAGALEPQVALERLQRRFVPPYLENAPPEPRSITAHSLALSRGEKAHWGYGYAQGGLLALWLEEKLLACDPPRASLSVVLRRLHERHPRGLPEDRFEALFEETSGLDVSEIFRRHVRGAEPLPIEEILARAESLRGALFQKR